MLDLKSPQGRIFVASVMGELSKAEKWIKMAKREIRKGSLADCADSVDLLRMNAVTAQALLQAQIPS